MEAKKYLKISWGKGILITYFSFVFGIGFLVYRSVGTKIDLVTDNYYEKTLIYQKEIEKANNSMTLGSKIKIEFLSGKEGEYLNITYPVRPDFGEITFYRPSDASIDFNVNVFSDENLSQKINVSGIRKGLWRMKFNWISSGLEYFHEEIITIQ